MKDYQEKFIRLALEAEALNFGDFTLKSGRKSPYFFNAAKMLNTKFLMSLSECYTKTIEDLNVTFDSIYGPAYKGIFLASIIGSSLGRSKLDIPISFNRKEEKEHGEGHDGLDGLHVRHARLCGHALVGHGHPHVDEHGAGHQQREATDVGAVKRHAEGQVEDAVKGS